MNGRILRWGDWLVAVVVVVLAVSSFLLTRPQGAAASATVTVDGQTVACVALPSHEVMELENGVVIRFEGMRACIDSSDCPDKTCVKRGWLSVAGQTCVCLPNRTVLRMDGGDIMMGG